MLSPDLTVPVSGLLNSAEINLVEYKTSSGVVLLYKSLNSFARNTCSFVLTTR